MEAKVAQKQSFRLVMARVFTGTLMSRVFGMIRDVLMASCFGATSSIASFYLAFRLAHFFRRMFGEGPLQSAFIPHFEKIKKEDKNKAQNYFSFVRKKLLFLLVFFAAAGMLASRSFAYYLGSSHLEYNTALYACIMFPSLIPICLYGLESAFLQCEGAFFWQAVAPVAFNLVWIACIGITLAFFSGEGVFFALCLGVVIACLFQYAVVFFNARSKIKATPSLARENFSLNSLGRAVGIGMLGVGASQFAGLIDAFFARFADPAGPAFLWYAIRLYQLPLALFGLSISSALIPIITRAFQKNDNIEGEELLQFGFEKIIYWMVPITCFVFLFGGVGIQILYEHGAFTRASVEISQYCLQGYILGLVPLCFIQIGVAALYARGDYLQTLRSSIVALALNTSLNAIFILYLSYGLASVAYATSISNFVNCFLIFYFLRKEGVKLSYLKLAFLLVFSLTASLISALLIMSFLNIGMEGGLILVEGALYEKILHGSLLSGCFMGLYYCISQFQRILMR